MKRALDEDDGSTNGTKKARTQDTTKDNSFNDSIRGEHLKQVSTGQWDCEHATIIQCVLSTVQCNPSCAEMIFEFGANYEVLHVVDGPFFAFDEESRMFYDPSFDPRPAPRNAMPRPFMRQDYAWDMSSTAVAPYPIRDLWLDRCHELHKDLTVVPHQPIRRTWYYPTRTTCYYPNPTTVSVDILYANDVELPSDKNMLIDVQQLIHHCLRCRSILDILTDTREDDKADHRKYTHIVGGSLEHLVASAGSTLLPKSWANAEQIDGSGLPWSKCNMKTLADVISQWYYARCDCMPFEPICKLAFD